MSEHQWRIGGRSATDARDKMLYRGHAVKKAHYRGRVVWEKAEGDDVRFIDWDGTVLYAMSAERFIRLKDWPSGIHPSKDTDEDREWGLHAHLLDDGWNWDFSAAQSFVRNYRYLDIGAEYATENDAVVIRTTIADDGGRQSLNFQGISSAVMSVDWGDGAVSASGNTGFYISHTYEKAGNYVITITPEVAGAKAQYGGFQAVAVTVDATRRYLRTLEGLYGTGGCTRNVVSVYYGKSAGISWGFCYSLNVRNVGFAKEVDIKNCGAGLWLAVDFSGTLIVPRATTYFNNDVFYRNASVINLYWSGANGFLQASFAKGVIYPDVWTGPADRAYLCASLKRYVVPPLCASDNTISQIYTGALREIVIPSPTEAVPSRTVSVPSRGPSSEDVRIYVESDYLEIWKEAYGSSNAWYNRFQAIRPPR